MITSLLKTTKMKKYYNIILFTLLSFLLSFNLYGQRESRVGAIDIVSIIGVMEVDTVHANGNRESQDINTLKLPDIYPNPARNNLYIEKNDTAIKKVELLTLQGQIQNQISIRHSTDKLQINIGGLQSGIYLLKLDTITGIIVEKIIVQ